MMQGLFGLLRLLLWPSLLLWGGAYVWLHYGDPQAFASGFPWIAPALLISAFVIGIRFNRSRAAFAALLVALCALLHLRGAPVNLLYCSLALGFAAFLFMRERGFLTLAGATRWMFVALVGLVGVLYQDLPALVAFANKKFLPVAWKLPCSHTAFVMLCIAGLLLVIRLFTERQIMESALFGSFLSVVSALSCKVKDPAFLVYLSASAVILCISVLEISYKLAYRDELTGLPARRALYETFAKLGGHYSLAMTDIDHFKKFNDKYGHDAGDEVLRMVAQKLARVTGGGKAFRYGGEEFTIVFPGMAVEETVDHLEALREAIEQSPFIPKPKPEDPKKAGKPKKRAPAAQKPVSVTISLGAAESERGLTPDEILKKADDNLYKSKKNGRNQLTY